FRVRARARAVLRDAQLCRRSAPAPLFPYTTLFRSGRVAAVGGERRPGRKGSRPGSSLLEDGSNGLLAAHEAQVEADPHVARRGRSEEHTSELQSRGHLVWRLPLEKKYVERSEERTT